MLGHYDVLVIHNSMSIETRPKIKPYQALKFAQQSLPVPGCSSFVFRVQTFSS